MEGLDYPIFNMRNMFIQSLTQAAGKKKIE